MTTELLQGDGFSVRIESRGGFVRAYVFGGVDSLEVSQAMWRLLAAQCRRFDASRLLVIEDLESTVAEDEIEAVIAAMLQSGFAGVRIAFVELRGDIQGSEHGEILAREHDLVVRVFGNETEARRWLLYGSN